jgi:excinuclease ABC subunit C
VREGFARLPSLILLDGGRGHVSAVKPVLEEYGFTIPLYGMVKDDKHRTRAIAQDGGEIAINASRSVFTLVSNIQEEVHRFSIAYHHNTAGRHSFASQLVTVPGIGESRAKALMKQFKTVERIKNASEEELAAVHGMNKKAAHALKIFFDKNDNV